LLIDEPLPAAHGCAEPRGDVEGPLFPNLERVPDRAPGTGSRGFQRRCVAAAECFSGDAGRSHTLICIWTGMLADRSPGGTPVPGDPITHVRAKQCASECGPPMRRLNPSVAPLSAADGPQGLPIYPNPFADRCALFTEKGLVFSRHRRADFQGTGRRRTPAWPPLRHSGRVPQVEPTVFTGKFSPGVQGKRPPGDQTGRIPTSWPTRMIWKFFFFFFFFFFCFFFWGNVTKRKSGASITAPFPAVS